MTEPSFRRKSKAYVSLSVMIFVKPYRDGWTKLVDRSSPSQNSILN